MTREFLPNTPILGLEAETSSKPSSQNPSCEKLLSYPVMTQHQTLLSFSLLPGMKGRMEQKAPPLQMATSSPQTESCPHPAWMENYQKREGES